MPGTTPAHPCPEIRDRLADVVVIGAGALGAATAWWLARTGRAVVVLDERTPRQLRAAARGTAWSAHPAWTAADEVAPLAAGVAAWREVEQQTGAALLTRCDALDHGDLLPGDVLPGDVVPGDAVAGKVVAGTAGIWLDSGAAAERRLGAIFAGSVLLRPGAGVQIRADHAA